MQKFNISASRISKSFDEARVLFSDLSLDITNGGSLGITGPNGSGKSTLLKILSSLLQPSLGAVDFKLDGAKVSHETCYLNYGLVAPYLNLYDELSLDEHIRIFPKLRSAVVDKAMTDEMLKSLRLYDRRSEPVKVYSTGMKQKAKYILALMNTPFVLFLDEPFANLDEAGIKFVKETVASYISADRAVVIASNDKAELSMCRQMISLV